MNRRLVADHGWLLCIALTILGGYLLWAAGDGDIVPPAWPTPIPAASPVVVERVIVEREVVVVTATATARPTRAPEKPYVWPTATPSGAAGLVEVGR